MINKILLSICIPTYNRAEILDGTLEHLLADPALDERVEIIVSDNCSTDNTLEIVKKYARVKYFRNETNVYDANYILILKRAQGQYLKLFNDTLRLKVGKLKKMLDVLENEVHDKKRNILFYQNYFHLTNSSIEFYSKNNLLRHASYLTTWIANFGIWREDFLKIQNLDKYLDTQFLQVDWCYREVENGKSTLIIADDYFTVVVPSKKGGYNIFNTFINKYLYLLREHKVAWYRYKIEKWRLMRYFILPQYMTFQFDKIEGKYAFDLNKQYQIIFKNYWYEPIVVLIGVVMLYVWIKRKFLQKAG